MSHAARARFDLVAYTVCCKVSWVAQAGVGLVGLVAGRGLVRGKRLLVLGLGAEPLHRQERSHGRRDQEAASAAPSRRSPDCTGPPPVSLPGADLAGADRLIGQEPPQVLGHRFGRLVPRLRVLIDRLQDDRLQVARDAGIDGPRLLRLLGLDLLDQLQAVRIGECRTEREQFVEGEPQRVDVGPSVAFASEALGHR